MRREFGQLEDRNRIEGEKKEKDLVNNEGEEKESEN